MAKKLPDDAKLGDDIHSFANFRAVVTRHLTLDVRVDFARESFGGSVTHRLEHLQDGVEEVLLDSNGITVSGVVDADTREPLEHDTPLTHSSLGTCVRVKLPKKTAGAITTIVVSYSTQSSPDGLQFFEPAQTLGKEQPLFFSQFQAILARTCLPCMDTPAVKAPVDMFVEVPKPLVVACGGIVQGEAAEVDGAHLRYHFRQAVPIPSYLIAVNAGDLKRKQIPGSDRCFAWAEPSLVDAVVEEFSDMESWLKIAEDITAHPYVWGTYEVLILPPFFAFGGMEHPNLTTLNRSVVVGDKSLVDVVMHEISHSWTGNLMTNCSWPDFWINEGFTMYLERAIVGRVEGEDMRLFHARLGRGELVHQMGDIETEDHRRLRPKIVGEDPDDAFSLVPYEKGFALLFHLELLVGGHSTLLGWIQALLKKFAGKSVCTDDIVGSFTEHFPEQAKEVQWAVWLDEPGLPPVDVCGGIKEPFSAKVGALVAKWLEGGDVAAGDMAAWSPLLVMNLLDELLESEQCISLDTLRRVDEVHSFSASKNAEILCRWLQLRLRARDRDCISAVKDYLLSVGRGKYVKPTFRRLAEFVKDVPEAREAALDIHRESSKLYCAYLRRGLAGILN